MNKMDKFCIIGIGSALLAAFLQMAYVRSNAYADSGHEGATRIERGSYIETRRIVLSSSTGTSLFAASTRRPDGFCRVLVEGNAVYVGTTSATENGQVHSNVAVGVPFFSTETFTLDGSITGALFATAGIGQTNVEVRCLDGLVR